MKPCHVQEMIAKIQVRGYDLEVPMDVVKQELSEYVGLDKYRLKYALETLVELGWFSWGGLRMMKINKQNGDSIHEFK